MNVARRLDALPCGRRSKWAVLALWIVVIALAGPLAGKLTGAEDNQTSSWLPSSAESTKVLRLEGRFTNTGVLPAVVVYTRDAGITAADRAAAAADAAAFARAPHVTGHVTGPIPSKDGKALQTLVPVDISKGGWNDLTPAVNAIKAVIPWLGGGPSAVGPAKNGMGTDGAPLIPLGPRQPGYGKQGYNAVPPAAGGTKFASAGDIYMDGRKVGQIVSRHQAASANGPLQGSAYMDGTAIFTPADFAYARG